MLTNKAKTCQSCNLVYSGGEDEDVVPGRTTPFPDIIRITPAPGVGPFLTTPPGGEEIKGGEVDTLSPLPGPPSVTETQEPGFDLTGIDDAMAPTGELVRRYCKL